jgi:hypothetical protein
MSTEPTEPLPAATPAADEPPAARHRPFRAGTLVWGLLLAAIGVLLILARQSGLALDAGQVLLWLLLGTGAALAIGGIIRASGGRN